MKRIATLLLTAAALATAVSAFATPNPNGVFVKTYIYSDCPSPFSTLTTTNNYPASFQFSDNHVCTTGYANLHNWSFSTDGGATAAAFNNIDAFRFGADFTLSGPGEGGIRISPWWGQDTEGRINVKMDGSTGEIACFGGYLPFYSFTGTNGLHYTGGVIHLEMIYKPNGNSLTEPGTIEYVVKYNGTSYATGPLVCGQANPNDPPHGDWGIEDDARVGGIVQPYVGYNAGIPSAGPGTTTATWDNIFFTTLPTPASKSTWGQLKSLYTK